MFRPGRANIIEQKRVVRAAAAHQVDALVVECMALQPALQSLCELKLVQSTHGVITNTRPDHLDVMGPDVQDVARALAGTVPVGGELYTAEQKCVSILQQAADDRGSRFHSLSDDELAKVTWDDLDRFNYVEHPENVALALRVCRDLGVERETALRGMWNATPDPGVMTVYQSHHHGSPVVFINGFAANDPESTGKIWEMALARYTAGRQRRIAVVNCRADRPDRSHQLADACVDWSPADHYVVVGSATDLFVRRAIDRGVDPTRIVSAGGASPTSLQSTLDTLTQDGGLIMGMGNISGPGFSLVQQYRQRQPSGDQRPQVAAPAIRKAA